MTDISLALNAAWQVLLVGLLLGVGLPAIFALGVRSLAASGAGGGLAGAKSPNPAGKALAYVCFFIIVVAVIIGLVALIADGFGKELVFQHIVVPALIDKKS